ncbi:hypothetical protein NUU61_000112 [Penicillium alfredii]|uniref:ribonuclease Z n=1 Tax=Penicillium alfredii TaxID=1506179 RepID=A0A9W9G941_9EURO|nr:uncharacterized protein NUU61_000112 [Penicillium alfredii]KAJ5114353.1 hypothetical protein NUU61_000112 [Penicillium alfredii]
MEDLVASCAAGRACPRSSTSTRIAFQAHHSTLNRQSWKSTEKRPASKNLPVARTSTRKKHADKEPSRVPARQPLFGPNTFLLPGPPLIWSSRKDLQNYVICDTSLFKKAETESSLPAVTGLKPMKFFYQVITTPTADTPGTTIALNFPDKRYFFGQLSEGTQRACTERGIRLSHLTDVFITGRTEWANTGGLIGIILTLADTVATSNAAIEEDNKKKAIRAANQLRGKAKPQAISKQKPALGTSVSTQDGQIVAEKGNLTLHGTTNLTHTVATARRFVFRKGMPVFMKEYDSESVAKQASVGAEDPFEEPTWSDANIKVWAMPLKPRPVASPKATSQTRSHSPRKRSLEEFQESSEQSNEPAGQLDQRSKDNLMRQSIVTDMFNSTWKMDALIETPLAEVNLPAAMFVRNPETKDLEPYHLPERGENEPLPDVKVFVRQPWPGATVESLPPTTPSPEALCYIVRNHDVRGKFDPAKAKALKVKMGPDCAALSRGKSVQSMDGQTITSDMVLGPARLGKGTAIMDLPSSEYVEDMINRPEWKSPAVTTELQSFIWILGPGVGENPKLREFVASMSHCEHTVSSSDYCPNYLALTSAASSSVRLARLKGDSYSIPVHDNVTLPQPGTPTAGSASATAALSDSPFKPVAPGFIIDMEPQFKLNNDEVMTRLNTAATLHRIPQAVEQRMSVIRRRVAKPAFQNRLQELRKDLPGASAEIIALGTGSSAPSKYRNVSATLLHAPGYGYYLLDCGENTLGQLKRVFEPEQLREVLRNLRMIWISHLHADHHLGTASIIKAWYHENYGSEATPAAEPETDMAKILQERRLFVVSNEMMIAWLEEYAAVENYGFDKLVPISATPETIGPSIVTRFAYRHCHSNGSHPGQDKPRKTPLSFTDKSSPLTPLLKSATGLDDFLTTRVKHCRGALAVSLVFPDGFKVSYSGDCRPSEKFAAIGQGSTVLIHEATFQDDMVGNAIAKRHSTASEALEVGRRMNARSILLTHFSQRYQKMAFIDQRAGTDHHDNVASSPQAEAAAAARKRGDADVPLDEPEGPEPTLNSSAHLLLDDLRFPRPNRRALPRCDNQVPGVTAPVAAAMDYMRIKVGDLALAQAYAPALEKLIDILERASAQESDRAKKERQEEEGSRKAKKNKKWPKHAAAEAAGTETDPAATAAAAVVVPETTRAQNPKSVWSASESESGWETSDTE